MTVRELIAHLSLCNQDAIVLIEHLERSPRTPTIRETRGIQRLGESEEYAFWTADPDESVEDQLEYRREVGEDDDRDTVIPAVALR